MPNETGHSRSATDATDVDVIVIGAGFAGLAMAIALERRGADSYLVLERASDVGGTWRDNDYPGCACDIPAILYSFSFRLNPRWSRIYPQQAEILAYLRSCSDAFGLRSHLRFGVEMHEARFDERTSRWTVRATDGRTFTGRVLVGGFGGLSKPQIPPLPGLDSFRGPAFHSAAWDHSVDLSGKTVAVIGTGASAIQFVPQVAPKTARTYLFQRTPAWVLPKADGPVGVVRRLLRLIPAFAWLERKTVYWLLEVRAFGFTLEPRILKRLESLAVAHLTKQVPDPTLRAKLTPDYRMGCKRILISNDFYPSLGRSNVEVVTDGIAEIRERSVVTDDGRERAVDALIFGTGFRATDGVAPMKIYGTNGVELGDVWRDGMHAYLGTSIPGFPNYFALVGPNTGLGHNSMVLMIEAQVRYVASALELLRDRRARSLDVRPDVAIRFNAWLERRLKRTVWASGCKSWYLDKNGKNTTLWPSFTFEFRRRTKRIDPASYDLTP